MVGQDTVERGEVASNENSPMGVHRHRRNEIIGAADAGAGIKEKSGRPLGRVRTR